MACNCSACGSGANQLPCFQRLTGDILSGLNDAGMLLYAFHTVELQYDTMINARPFAGDPGQAVSRKVKLDPPPEVVMNIKIYQPDGTILEKTGTAKIKKLLARDLANGPGYTGAELESASYWLIDGCKYDLVEGSLIRPSNGIFWEAILQKTKVS